MSTPLTIAGSTTHRIPGAGGVRLSVDVVGSGSRWPPRGARPVRPGRPRPRRPGRLPRRTRPHPAVVTHLACLDVLPTLDKWDVLHGQTAAVAFHLYLTAQPPGLPEQLIGAAPDVFFGYFLHQWGVDPAAIPPPVRAQYLAACRAAVPSIVADYRASAGIDVEHDQADRAAGRTLAMPVTVLAQDWGDAMGFDPVARWSRWAPDLQHVRTRSGHFMAEQDPAGVTAALRALLTR